MRYVTVERQFIAEIEEKKSRFIAHLIPYEDFDAVLQRLRVEHRKANHHVTAFRVMNRERQIQEIGKDDGEPSGTSGLPILKTMIGAGLMNSAIIVTRYFGGTKLGTGGLARAYSGAAKLVIEAADLIPWEFRSQTDINVGFHMSADIEAFIAKRGLTVVSRDYHEAGTKMHVEGIEKAVLELNEYVASLRA